MNKYKGLECPIPLGIYVALFTKQYSVFLTLIMTVVLIVQWWRHCTAVTITITLPFAKNITTIVNPSTFGRIMWNLSLIPLWPAFRFGFYEKDVWKRKKLVFGHNHSKEVLLDTFGRMLSIIVLSIGDQRT